MIATLAVVGLMFLGVALLAVEVLLVPGVGLVGFLGLLGMAGSVWVAYAQLGATYGGLALAASAVSTGLAFWLLPKTQVAKSMVLDAATTAKVGDPTLLALVGKEGAAVTTLRPAGSIDIDGRIVDVVSDGDYVERGAKVRVTEVKGQRVVVMEVPRDG